MGKPDKSKLFIIETIKADPLSSEFDRILHEAASDSIVINVEKEQSPLCGLLSFN